MTKDRSPFFPGMPVSPELFVGRGQQIARIERSLRQAKAGKPQYLFVTGERGIGKSSLAKLAKELAEKEHGFVAAQAMLGGAETLGEGCRRLYQALVSQLPDKSLMEKIRALFERYIEKIDLFGIGVEFRRDQATRQALAEDFLLYLARIGEIVRDASKRGLLLVADDLNGIVGDPKFAHFLKSTVDQMAVGPMREFPWLFMLVGVPGRMEDLKKHQPSVGRIFDVIDLPAMDPGDAIRFYKQSFESVDHRCEDSALALMAGATGGLPVMWHELGDAVFWEDQDEVIDGGDVARGFKVAVDTVGRKYLARPLYEELHSEVYHNILQYISSLGRPQIHRGEALSALPEREGRNFDNFIRKMRRLGVLRTVRDSKGTYEFTSLLFQVYVMLRSVAGPLGL